MLLCNEHAKDTLIRFISLMVSSKKGCKLLSFDSKGNAIEWKLSTELWNYNQTIFLYLPQK